MRQMKDSKIEWVGKIPENWEVKRIKYIVKIRNGNGFYNPETDIYIGMENIKGYSNEIVATNSEYETSVQSTFEKGDILFGKLRPYLAKVIEINCSGFCSSEFLIFSGFKGYKSFLRFSLLNPKFIENINASTYGAKMPRANSEYILNQKIAIPPFTEQKEIAEYLDETCGEIDALLADIKDEIETLEQYKRSVITESVTKGLNPSAPMKNSGIEWVGEIPEHWEIHPLYYYFSERKRKNILGKETNLLSLSYGKVIRKDINTSEGLLPENYNGYNIVEQSDIVLRLTDLQNDKRSLRTGLIKERGILTSAYVTIKPIKAICSSYFHYALHSYDIMKVFYNMGNGVRQGLNYDELSKCALIAPPLSEQQEIAEYLDKKCAEIDEVISDKQTEIQTLESYKKSLIYEYVTGKKEVKSDVSGD